MDEADIDSVALRHVLISFLFSISTLFIGSFYPAVRFLLSEYPFICKWSNWAAVNHKITI